MIELETFEEAMKDTAWYKAMESEIGMVMKNETSDIVNKPSDK